MSCIYLAKWIPHNNVASVILGKQANSTELLLSISLKVFINEVIIQCTYLQPTRRTNPNPIAEPCLTMSLIFMTVLSENVSSLTIRVYKSYKANDCFLSPCHCRFTLWMTQKYYSIYLQSLCPHI